MDNLDLFVNGPISPAVNILRRAADSSAEQDCGPNACEKPTSSSTFTLPIILGVAVPLVGAAILFLILQRRHMRKIREEDANDRHASLDFGLGEVSRPNRSNKSSTDSLDKEKKGLSHRQVSMDMSMGSPYLLSLESKKSRESLETISKPLRKEDPYEPVSHYLAGENSSIRPPLKGGSSESSGSIKSQLRLHDNVDRTLNIPPISKIRPPNAIVHPPRHNSLLPYQPVNNYEQNYPNQNIYPTEPPQSLDHRDYITPLNRIGNGQDPNQYPPPVHLAGSENVQRFNTQNTLANYGSDSYGDYNPAFQYNSTSTIYEGNNAQPQNSFSNPHSANVKIPGIYDMNYQQDYETSVLPGQHENNMGYTSEQPYISGTTEELKYRPVTNNRGNNHGRFSILGARPLPPDTVTETDDPEIRANRIRSFYKEYFDESTPNPTGTHEKNIYPTQMEGSVFYEPDSNQFVLPYAQPVTRRAMTPPPTNTAARPRRQRNGSMGRMNDETRRVPSNFSADIRPQSSSSASQPLALRKPTLPFLELNQLPAPGRMNDDSLAINPLEYVQPAAYRGYSGSNRTEYSNVERQYYPPMNHPSYELSQPSTPQSMRKPGPYSPSNFTPPKKLRDGDNNNDAASIRSFKSGKPSMRAPMHQNNSQIVNQLSEDIVFSKNGLNSNLRPQWDMSR